MDQVELIKKYIAKGWLKDVQRLMPCIISFSDKVSAVVYSRETLLEQPNSHETEEILHDPTLFDFSIEFDGSRFAMRHATPEYYKEYPNVLNNDPFLEFLDEVGLTSILAEPQLMFAGYFDPTDETRAFLKLSGYEVDHPRDGFFQ